MTDKFLSQESKLYALKVIEDTFGVKLSQKGRSSEYTFSYQGKLYPVLILYLSHQGHSSSVVLRIDQTKDFSHYSSHLIVGVHCKVQCAKCHEYGISGVNSSYSLYVEHGSRLEGRKKSKYFAFLESEPLCQDLASTQALLRERLSWGQPVGSKPNLFPISEEPAPNTEKARVWEVLKNSAEHKAFKRAQEDMSAEIVEKFEQSTQVFKKNLNFLRDSPVFHNGARTVLKEFAKLRERCGI